MRIDPVITGFGLTGRSVLGCPAGECIILHYPPTKLDPPDLSKVLDSDPSSHEDDGEIFYQVGSPWCSTAPSGSPLNTFNCCTFAVADVVGLTPADWINPVASGNTDNLNPMEVLLESFFQPVKVYRGPSVDWAAVERDEDLRVNDVLCYVRQGEDSLEFVHAGKICRRNGKNWLLSKFGCGPLVKAPLSATGAYFSDQWDEVRVYRPKTDRA